MWLSDWQTRFVYCPTRSFTERRVVVELAAGDEGTARGKRAARGGRVRLGSEGEVLLGTYDWRVAAQYWRRAREKVAPSASGQRCVGAASSRACQSAVEALPRPGGSTAVPLRTLCRRPRCAEGAQSSLAVNLAARIRQPSKLTLSTRLDVVPAATFASLAPALLHMLRPCQRRTDAYQSQRPHTRTHRTTSGTNRAMHAQDGINK